MSTTRVIILAAGKGKRMGGSVPKPLVPIAGKPMLVHLLDSVLASGVDQKPIIVVSVEGELLFREVLGDRVEYAMQHEQLGTGHALMAASEIAREVERVLVLYGDHPFLRAEVIQGLCQLVADRLDAVGMLTATVPNFDGNFSVFEKWGRILRSPEGKVLAIREAKDSTPEELAVREVNPAMYAFPAPWVWESLKMIKNTNASGEYYLTDLIGLAMKEGKEILTAPAEPLDVIGVNSPEELSKAEAAYLSHK